MEQIRITRSNMAGMNHRRKYQFREVTNTFAFAQPEHLEVVRITFFHRHCVRAVKEMDSKSIGLCPQGFESPRCRYLFPLHMRTMFFLYVHMYIFMSIVLCNCCGPRNTRMDMIYSYAFLNQRSHTIAKSPIQSLPSEPHATAQHCLQSM